MTEPIYEDTPIYAWWLKLIVGVVLVTSLAITGLLLFEEVYAALVALGITALEALLFKAVLPQRFQIFGDRLRIVLGGPLALNIGFSSIVEAREVSGLDVLPNWGIRFMTSTGNLVEIVRHENLNVVIAPANRDIFLQHLHKAIEAALPEPPP